MAGHNVVIFKPYPFVEGQKVRIEGGPRAGDWQVINVSDRRLQLRCPISHREVDWERFCCFCEEKEDEPWPLEA